MEFSASVGFIHKESVTIHGHTILKSSYDSLWIRPTDALNSSFIGITTLQVSGSLSAHHQEFLAVHRVWYISCSFDDRLLPEAGWNPAPGSIRSSQLHKMYQSRCTAKNSWWLEERLPETCRIVIPIKLEFSASVGFIHKESYEYVTDIWQRISAASADNVVLVLWPQLRCKIRNWVLFSDTACRWQECPVTLLSWFLVSWRLPKFWKHYILLWF